MKTLFKTGLTAMTLGTLLMADLAVLGMALVPDAHAVLGVRRRTAVVAGATVHAADSAQMAQSQQQAAAAQQQAAASQQQAAAAKQEAADAKKEAEAAKQQAAVAPPAAAAAAGQPLPLGTVTAALPAGCVSTPVGGVEYYYCGGNFYRAVFQGNTLVYVTAKP
jgi:predicted lipid-binding transport protein (Tim44 family)